MPACDVCTPFRDDFATDISIMHRNDNYSYALANPRTMSSFHEASSSGGCSHPSARKLLPDHWYNQSALYLPIDYHDSGFEGPIHDKRSRQISCELAGRSADHTFKDFRSTHKAKRRRLAEKEKYWGYRAVKRGQLDVPYYACEDEEWPGGNPPSWTHTALPSETATTITDKHMLYYQAQRYPRPPKYHYSHRWDKVKYLPRKHEKHWVSKGREFDEATYAIDPLNASERYVVNEADANTDVHNNADCYAGGVTWAFIARKLEDCGPCEQCGKDEHRHVDGVVHCNDDDVFREYAFWEYDGQLDEYEWAVMQEAFDQAEAMDAWEGKGPQDTKLAAEGIGQDEEAVPLSDCGSKFEFVVHADDENEGAWTLV